MLEIITNVHLEMLLRLLISAILGLLIGLERELKRKSLGLKTILVISIVSCLLTIVSIQSAYLLPGSALAEIRMDPLRLAAQIVTGVGFLGAGVILRREDDTISGLTTAAIVWGAAGIGVAIGAGFYIEAIVGVGLLLISVEIIPYIIFRLGFEQLKLKEFQIAVTLNSRENIEEVVEQIEREVVRLGKVNIQDKQVNNYVVEVEVKVYQDLKPTELYQKLAKIKNIDLIELNS
ncbi:MgtC/SapB family protein [Pseudogracilibacillus sp. SO30301A]|uniref:MgtC/SapB family protein n=1 Tax=Pseudogracilibacillus sp. SO30301A TaxID=3098291 RepID=UPI00300DD181